ncbi:protein of unknown function [Burkholderia multivorans]
MRSKRPTQDMPMTARIAVCLAKFAILRRDSLFELIHLTITVAMTSSTVDTPIRAATGAP